MKISRSQLLMQQTHTHTLTTPQTVKLLFMLTTNVLDRNISPYEKIELFLNFLGSTPRKETWVPGICYVNLSVTSECKWKWFDWDGLFSLIPIYFPLLLFFFVIFNKCVLTWFDFSLLASGTGNLRGDNVRLARFL